MGRINFSYHADISDMYLCSFSLFKLFEVQCETKREMKKQKDECEQGGIVYTPTVL